VKEAKSGRLLDSAHLFTNMPARRGRGTSGTLSRAVSQQPRRESHGTVPTDSREDVNQTTRLLEGLIISASGQDRETPEMQGATRALQNMTIAQGHQQRDTPPHLAESMQRLAIADESQSWQVISSNGSIKSRSESEEEPEVYQEHVHFYHHRDGNGVSKPTHTFEEVATIGAASQMRVDQGWHRFTYPSGLKAKEEAAFMLALQVLICTKYLKGLPRVKVSIVNRRKFIDVCRVDSVLREGAKLDEIKVEVKVGTGAATRTKEVIIYSHDYNPGLGVHLARFDVLYFDPDPDQDPTTEADFIVDCLNERLRQGKVLDAWIDMTTSSDGDQVWNGGIVCLVAFYSDIGMTTFTKSPKKVHKMQHGYLDVDGQQLKLVFPHRKFWCIYCKASTPFERFHMIKDCPATRCLYCPDKKRHQTLHCPEGRRNRRPPVAE
jgi:hypothetical protein